MKGSLLSIHEWQGSRWEDEAFIAAHPWFGMLPLREQTTIMAAESAGGVETVVGKPDPVVMLVDTSQSQDRKSFTIPHMQHSKGLGSPDEPADDGAIPSMHCNTLISNCITPEGHL